MEYSTNGTDLVKGESLKRGTAVPAEMKINAESAMLALCLEGFYSPLFQWISKRILFYAQKAERVGHTLKIVINTRRCAVLVEMFMQIVAFYAEHTDTEERPKFLENLSLDELKKILDCDASFCLTDGAALASANEWTKEYIDKGTFPMIVYLDDVIVHGRSLNAILRNMEFHVLACYREAVPSASEKDLRDVRNALVDSTWVDVFMESSNGILLYPRYQYHYHAEKSKETIDYRKLSNRVSMAITSSNVCNVSHALGLVYDTAPKPNHALPSEFLKVRTGIRNEPMLHYLYPFPDKEHPRAIGSLRVKRSAATGEWMVIPYWIMAQAPVSAYLQARERLLEYAGAKEWRSLLERYPTCFSETENLWNARWLAESVNLVLSRMLLSYAGVPADKCTVNIRQLTRNFGVDDKAISALCRENFAGQDFLLTEILTDLLRDSSPIWNAENSLKQPDIGQSIAEELENLETECEKDASGNRNEYVCWDGEECPSAQEKEIFDSVRDLASRMGLESEENAYQNYRISALRSEKELASSGKRYTISDFYGCLASVCTSAEDFAQATTCMIHMMDQGALVLRLPSDNGDGQTVGTVVCSGEPSLALKPMQYEEYLFVLDDIQQNCLDNNLSLDDEIRKMVARSSKAGLENTSQSSQSPKLLLFINGLNESGQNAIEWRFGLMQDRQSFHETKDAKQQKEEFRRQAKRKNENMRKKQFRKFEAYRLG